MVEGIRAFTLRLSVVAGLCGQMTVGVSPAAAQAGLWAPEKATAWHEKGLARSRQSMVVAANPLAVEAGLAMLRAGGTAVDAAIAVQLVLGLVEPQSSGLGGGAFLVHWQAGSKTLRAYDGRETAPSSAKPDRFLVQGRPLPFRAAVKSALSIGVPGTVRLLAQVHERHGRLAWAKLFEPALMLSEKGFAVSPRLAGLLADASPASFDAKARALFFDAQARPLPAGYWLRNPAYAATLRLLAQGGAAAFYGGSMADAIVAAAAVPQPGIGSVSIADLAAYRVVEREPICVPYRGNRVCGIGPPSSGAASIGQALVMLEPFDLGHSSRARMAPQTLHLIGEALKLAFADRNRYLADPSFVAPPSGFLDAGYLAERRSLISPYRPSQNAQPGKPPGSERQSLGPDFTDEAAGTSHISVIDGTGNAVAMTTTIEAAFGSGRMAGGFLLNNELTDFSFRPKVDGLDVANRVEGGKRPRSSMAPTIVLGPDGQPVVVVGSAGGSMIIPYVLKALIGVIDWKLDAMHALALPNFGSRGRDFELEWPQVSGFAGLSAPASVFGVVRAALGLKPYGHVIRLEAQTSGTHLIVRQPDGTLEGAADPRREGLAQGQ